MLWNIARSWRDEDGCWSRELGRDVTLRLPHGPGGQWLHVERGQVLVTLEGDPEDHVLSAGETLMLSGGGLAVAWALHSSRIRGGDVHGAQLVGRRPRSKAA
jgi:hypothetical protein